MIRNLSIKNKKLIIVLIFIAVLIPIIIFITASVAKSNSKIDDIAPTPIDEIPSEEDENAYELELLVGVPTIIPGTDIELKLVSTSNQPADCFDCIALTIVEVQSAGEVAVWDYACGGFSGECNYQFKKFGYVIEALDLKIDSMVVKVYPEE